MLVVSSALERIVKSGDALSVVTILPLAINCGDAAAVGGATAGPEAACAVATKGTAAIAAAANRRWRRIKTP
jgi:hypothetical protein